MEAALYSCDKDGFDNVMELEFPRIAGLMLLHAAEGAPPFGIPHEADLHKIRAPSPLLLRDEVDLTLAQLHNPPHEYRAETNLPYPSSVPCN
jgi:hypothetical protein